MFGKTVSSSPTGPPSTVVDLLPPDYGFVLIVAALLVFEGLVLGSMVMTVRKQAFSSKEFQSAAKVSSSRPELSVRYVRSYVGTQDDARSRLFVCHQWWWCGLTPSRGAREGD
jgi:hypothetical protein